mmetsp:Transcript_4614/g.11844  ORF Transcript_4614/g.11844 Transcript_4614/m.11844 type:complete len:215 (+) Transcript_4614:529-1173(+)
MQHAKDGNILVTHVVRALRQVLRRLQFGDDGQLLDDLLQQLHLVGAVDVHRLVLGAVLLDLRTELEDRGRDLPHRLQHPLQRAHRQLCHHIGECEAAKDHDGDDEAGRSHGHARLQLRLRVHVEAHAERVRVDQHRGRLASGALHHRVPPREVHSAVVADEVTDAIDRHRSPYTGHEWPVVVAAIELRHQLQFNKGLVNATCLHVHGEPLDPSL